MQPRVTGPAVTAGRVGRRPVGEPGTILKFNADYKPAWAPQLSFDLGVSHFGGQAASRDNALRLPAYTLVDVGARYRSKVGDAPASFRVSVANATYGANTFGLTDGRRVSAYLSVDF